MISFGGPTILLDIEGTTSSVRFVYDEMFPFARRELAAYLREAWGTPALRKACDLMARDVGHDDFQQWQRAAGQSPEDSAQKPDSDDEWPRLLVQREAERLMDADAKQTGLKELQGLIWKSGFASGELKSHLYPDVHPALRRWSDAGIKLYIYSSGSISAQKLFFGHTQDGDLLPLISGHYDTTIGNKRSVDSYRSIAAELGANLAESSADQPDDSGAMLFLSDIVEELDAAREAGLRTGLCLRPENAAVGRHTHPEIRSFKEVAIES